MAAEVSNLNKPPMLEMWESIPKREGEESSSSSCLTSALETSKKIVNWVINYRGGIDFLTGALILPSQYTGFTQESSQNILQEVQKKFRLTFEKYQTRDYALSYVIFYPNDWKEENNDKCILYHNPNGITTAGFFISDDSTPHKLMDLYRCPIVMYDYRGSGLNQDVESNSSSCGFKATHNTVVEDGTHMTAVALEKFKHVDIVGSSLGGGVGMVSLSRYLQSFPEDVEKVTLTNHDSFTSTIDVVFPNFTAVGHFVGFILGGSIDARRPMLDLISMKVNITVLCHLRDPVIPLHARMAEYVESLTLVPESRVKVIKHDAYGHANLPYEMIRALRA